MMSEKVNITNRQINFKYEIIEKLEWVLVT